MVKNIIFIDLDNTTLDNVALKVEINNTLKDILKSENTEKFWTHYEDCRENSGLIDLPEALTSYFRGDTSIRDLVFENINYKKCVYSGTIDCINFLKTKGEVYVFSEGNIKYQGLKAKKTGIAEACDGVYIFKSKLEHLQEIKDRYSNKNLIFIDDKPRILKEIKARINAKVVLVRQGYYSEDYKYSVKDFDTVMDNIGDIDTLAKAGIFL